MRKNLFIPIFRKKMVFTRWTRRSDSVFLSLGRSIKISALTAGYFLLNAFTTNAQTDTIKIQEVTISAYKTPVNFADAARIISLLSAGEIEDAPLTSINDALKSAMNVDVRERGVYGVQSDLNIRGGSFDQNVVLINGVRMSDPQTGHFQMNLPIDLIDIERIEMLHGASSSLYGNNAFSGAINIITGNDDRSGVKVGLLAGEHELFGGNIALNLSTKKIKNYLSVAKKVSAGYTQNTDFDILNLFYKGKLITEAGALQLQAGYLDKSFGANNFYTPVYPNQYEENKTWMANLKFFTNGNFKISPSIYFRRNFDRFELFRNNPPAWYTNHNYHTTDVYGAEIGTQFNTGSGQMALGADWNTESILSNKLGEVLDNEQAIKGVEGVSYTNGKTRQNFTAFFEQRFRFNNFQISTSLSANFNSMFDWNFYPGIDLSLNINPNFKLIASASRSGRIPTYTDLYYVGPTNIGNPDLKTETANTFEFGSKYITKTLIIQSAIFFRQGNNII
ncbi:MAG: TonB-dependent receptor, partial [Bacteroidales bacterium]|nr:TonB-dependent receptor [Bacteroidales bacterium]